MNDLENDGRFASVLDECCERVRRGEPLERCLAGYPAEYREELRRLVPVGGRVSLLTRDPSPEFQARLEERLLADLAAARRTQRGGIIARIGRLLSSTALTRTVVTAVAILLVLAGSGIEVDRASAGSLPDSPLYQVKVAREQVQLALAQAPESQVDVHAAQLGERDKELDQAIRGGKQPKVVQALVARVEGSVERMVDQALKARAKGNLAPARRALVVIRAAERQVDRVTPAAQPSIRPALQELRSYLERQEQQLTAGGGNPPGV